MRYLNLILSLVVLGYGVYYSVTVTTNSYGPALLIIGAIWLIADIIAIKKHNFDKNK